MKPTKGEGLYLAVALGALLLLVLYALSIPMRHGARPWEAVAVLPQVVLWFIPLVFAFPVLVYFANQLRPHWVPRATPQVEDPSAGTLAFLADAIRASRSSPLARSRVMSQLVRLAVRIVAQRFELPEEDAWATFREHCRKLEPDVARFLEREDPGAVPHSQFDSYVRRTIAFLERESEEA